jgi:hypothetical protein
MKAVSAGICCVIVVVISKMLDGVYCNSNKSSDGTFGCSGGRGKGKLLKFHNVHCIYITTSYSNLVATVT